MKATEKPILKFLEGPKQFFVPIFQRRYSWEQKNCQQLWTDVLNAGEDDKMAWHFLGSIVYLEPEVQNTGSLSEYLVIDGQQRLTTLSLLLLALSRSIREEDDDIGITPNQISNYYLFNNEVDKEELRHKLRLTKGDNETFGYLLKTKELLPQNASPFLVKNYRFFEKMLKDVIKGNITDDYGNSRDVSLKTVYIGLNKLMVVDIILERNENNPQKYLRVLIRLESISRKQILSATMCSWDKKPSSKIDCIKNIGFPWNSILETNTGSVLIVSCEIILL